MIGQATRRLVPDRRATIASVLMGSVASLGLGALIGAGYGLLALGAVILAVACVVGLADWRVSIYGLLLYLPYAGIAVVAAYPDTRVPVLAKDFLFVIPAYAGFLLSFIVRREPVASGRSPVFLIGSLTAIVLGQALNPALPNRLVAAIGVKIWLLYIPLIVLGYHLVRTRDDLERLLRWMVIAALVPLLIGLTQALFLSVGRQDVVYGPYGDAAQAVTQNFAEFSIEGGGLLRRVPSTFSFGAQYFAFLIGMTSVAYAWWRGFSEERGESVARGILWLLIVCAGLVSGARAAFVFVPLLIVLIALLEHSDRIAFAFGRIAAVVGVTIVAVALVGSTIGGLFAYILRLGAVQLQSVFVDGFRMAFRITLLGLGTGVDTNASRYAFGRSELFPAVDGVWYESWWVKAVLELGVPGLIVASVLLGTIVVRGIRRHRKLADSRLRTVSACLLAFLMWNLIYNMKAQPMDIDPINVYFWLFAGLLARLPELEAAPRSTDDKRREGASLPPMKQQVRVS